jgi:type II secretory pathway pseudopilin PulG
MGSSNRLIVAMLIVAALAVGFWVLLLSPKRQEADELSAQATQAQESLALDQAEVGRALQARRQFPVDYQQLVVLGKAVPASDETASLLVQINHVAKRTGVSFRNLALAPASGTTETPVPAAAGSAGSSPISATEAAASTLPLGASIGTAGLAVMPYTLTFKGDFFHLADFIGGLDSLVKTQNSKVAVSGRLMTIDSFSLAGDENVGFPALEASFYITTYLTPPGQGVTAGATPTTPEAAGGTPVSTTTGGTP